MQVPLLTDVCKIVVDPGVAVAPVELFSKDSIRYAMTRTEVKMNTIAKGSLEFTWDTMFQALRHSCVVLGLLEQRAINTDYKNNPFGFQNFRRVRGPPLF